MPETYQELDASCQSLQREKGRLISKLCMITRKIVDLEQKIDDVISQRVLCGPIIAGPNAYAP